MLLLLLVLDLNLLDRHGAVSAQCTDPITVLGAGSSFPGELYDYAAAEYEFGRRHHRRQVTLTYRSVNSGYGKSRIISQNEDPPIVFAGSESLLSGDIQKANPTIRTVPILAGAIAVVYALPNVTGLTLSVTDLSDIYMGKIQYWDHPNITLLNPNISLPHVAIAPVARSDDGGDTEIFTSALAKFSEEWKNRYGTFLSPKFKSGFCCEDSQTWPKNVVNLYGNRVLGMMGLISSIPYTIGYAAMGNVKNTDVKVAKLRNSAGRIVEPTIKAVQEAIDYFVKLNPHKTVFPINNALSPEAYPMASFSYIMFNDTTAAGVSCCEVQEFIGFVETVFSQRPHIYDRFSLVGVTRLVEEEIIKPELKRVLCEGQPQYEAYQRSKVMPERTSTSMVVLSCAVALGLCFAVLVGLLLRQRQAARLAAMNLWNLPASEFRSKNTKSVVAQTPLRNGAGGHIPILFYDNNPVMSELVPFARPERFSAQARDTMWAAKKITSENLLKLIGLTTINDRVNMVYEYPSRGCVHYVLRTTKLTISPMIRVGIVSDLINGVEFLHRNNITHGRLNCLNVFFDMNWTIKIGHWAGLMVASAESAESYTEMTEVKLEDKSTENVIKQIFLDQMAMRGDVDNGSDIYATGLLAVNIMTSRLPYLDEMGSGDLRRHMKSKSYNNLVPFPDLADIDPPVRALIKKCIGPRESIPDSKQLKQQFDIVNPCKKGIVEAMMITMEDHMRTLEDSAVKRAATLTEVTARMKDFLHELLPPQIAERLVHDEAVKPEYFECCSVSVADVVGFSDLHASSTPQQIMSFLNDLWKQFDKAVEGSNAYKVDTINDAYLLCSGLPVRNGNEHIREICLLAKSLMMLASQFRIQHLPNKPLKIRIGISSGPVTTGIVGVKMPRYCVFGDTVNTASLMESTATAMRIQLSQKAEELLSANFPGEFQCEYRGEVDLKGKGSMKTYWLLMDLGNHGRQSKENATGH